MKQETVLYGTPVGDHAADFVEHYCTGCTHTDHQGRSTG